MDQHGNVLYRKMDHYTRMYFFEEIEDILNSRPVEKICPVLIFFAEDELPTMLHFSGNKVIGNITAMLESIFGYIDEGSLTDIVDMPRCSICGHEVDNADYWCGDKCLRCALRLEQEQGDTGDSGMILAKTRNYTTSS